MKRSLMAACFALPLFAVQVVGAEELDTIFKNVNELVSTKNYSKALDELGWAKKEIEKLHIERIQSFFPDKLGDYSGGKFESNSALGFMDIQRTYTSGGSSLKLSLTGGQGGAGVPGLGGLAALGQMAAMMGQQSGQDTVRISGRTAQIQVEEGGNGGQLNLFLNSGSILKLEMYDGAKSDLLKSLAEQIKLDELDTYLKG